MDLNQRPAFERDLVSEVDRVFASLSADASGWPDPHRSTDGSRRSPADDEYSRLRDPEKYAILHRRAQAWRQVLAERERCRVESAVPIRWAIAPRVSVTDTWLLEPVRKDAAPLVLAHTAGGEHGEVPGLMIGVAEPASPGRTRSGSDAVIPICDLPQCGCDACDDGSEYLLSEIDRAILGVLDGSTEATVTKRRYQVKSSFGGHGASPANGYEQSARVAGAPWSEQWREASEASFASPHDFPR